MKKAIFIVGLLISLIIINNSIRSIYSLWQKRDLLTEAGRVLQKEKAKNASLKGKLQEVDKPEFVEKEARDKLFLVKPGEQIVLVPKEQKKEEKNPVARSQKPNWQQWWELFF